MGTQNRRRFLRQWIGVAAVILVSARAAAPAERQSPGFGGAVGWLNSAPLDKKALQGKVVLVNFWTYSCINSLRELPYMKAWAAKYKDAGLVVVGVHTPEFGFEKENANVKWAIKEYNVSYPVAVDTAYGVWNAFHNNSWPANYIIDAKGRIRFHYFGEGAYEQMEQIIRGLLKETGATLPDGGAASVPMSQVEAPPGRDVQSPETYVGYRRTERFVSTPRIAEDDRKAYRLASAPRLNQWGLGGVWNVGGERAALQTEPGKIVFRFRSRDLHMVLGPSKSGQTIRFRVTLDGQAVGLDRGADVNTNGEGTVKKPRLYQLVRQKGKIEDRTFTIEFLDPGVQAFSFTFG